MTYRDMLLIPNQRTSSFFCPHVLYPLPPSPLPLFLTQIPSDTTLIPRKPLQDDGLY